MSDRKLLLSSSPHIFSPVDTPRIMLSVVIALMPATAYGIYLYGLPALGVVVTSIAAAVVSEFLFRKLIKASMTVGDFSAVVSGLLLALILPPSTPLWMVALGAIFAIVIAKEFFGGLGANPFNPALIGRAFLLMSFPAAITSWSMPKGLGLPADALSAATPLNLLKQGNALADVAKYFGASDTGAFYRQLFMGYRSGSIGESSILLVLLGGLFLLGIGVIQWIVPVSVLASTFVFSWLLGMDPVLGLLTGGIVFGAFFMATDYATRPLTPYGQAIFGIGIGLITVLIRKFGGYPEGVTYAILIMNILTPFLNKLRVKKYGFVPPPKPARPSKEATK
ncbi:Electron transport complex, RnfABCDGE type, D subunit [uncultured spirochete]|jgi:electron transport complex protein RnfD|uniref:Ion-translocating oxidoreductase complex subunit D n=1 Tax=uncultured spirochete TaxID=156406 RepID=A0A3P3XJ26_9SPIR|nr:Electron transport complex, RnfABCDGE type, D subunit [uncultured spirochete]HBE46209.1 NADH-quinone reductase [Spirochaetaceae bacterium]